MNSSARAARAAAQLLGRGLRAAHADVVFDRSVKEPCLLADHGDAAPQLREAERTHVDTADRDLAMIRIVKAQEQPRDGRLARPARPHERHALARADAEAHPVVRGAAPARIGERHAVEYDAGVAGLGTGVAITHDRHRIEQLKDPARRRETEHALVEKHAQLAQRTEDLDAEHEHDEQRRQRHGSIGHAPGADGERRRGAEGDAGVGDAARQRVGAEHPHRAPEQRPRARLEAPRAVGALSECLERGEPLHGVEEVGAEGGVGAVAGEARPAIPAMPQRRREEHDERGEQHDERGGQVDEGDEGEDENRRERGHEELRQVLAEIHFQLLHALDQRQHDLATAMPREVRGPERDHLRVEHPTQPLLHARSRPMGDHRAHVLERAAREERAGGERERGPDLRQRPRHQNEREHPSEQRQPRDAGADGGQAEEDGAGDPAADSRRERPQPAVEIHAVMLAEAAARVKVAMNTTATRWVKGPEAVVVEGARRTR